MTPADPRPTAEETKTVPYDPTLAPAQARLTWLNAQNATLTDDLWQARTIIGDLRRVQTDMEKRLRAAQAIIGQEFVSIRSQSEGWREAVAALSHETSTLCHDLAVANAAVAELKAKLAEMAVSHDDYINTAEVVYGESEFTEGELHMRVSSLCDELIAARKSIRKLQRKSPSAPPAKPGDGGSE